ncbi:hypothetical protein A3D80_00060 [Candidatus Roizmanbacteria bacterium RIFCSPHIGHO2_02_FULL_40_13b]|uniref:SCP domain-containing protein n=1 Tax=Candidatus Roizmanbacteria bacterium RIFCSPHIGHO2_01_FULL_39_24 TaxID=1802032 RepID=A0A1F7GIX0_9BACT|nr:MAG: hypothetical protein A2799_03830 [Candidatus Roizmanbacteria bacterium RIFCSPHIGHO2_01_FULL_39_24]OGK27780.1 MAG: hypothetical protein A3D80_00060 [Candidatus Roizmanbacteria bacterium RIFCSPHIGHO2_02_FULL_40_13b]OGK56401.1 MAG: hypothetical protein A3H83_01130 [Candidatus Roizmanbacteria bacterium RIFCSPLOWO2_02_FULL_39_8]
MSHSFLHGFFIPSKHNNFRARALHLHFLTAYLVIAMVISFAVSPNSILTTGSVLGIAQDISTDKLLQLTNQQRTNSGLPALNNNSQLASAACGKANKMIADNFWAHYAPDGTTPWFYIAQSGYKYETAGENLAKDFGDSNSVVNAWMASSGHAANILSTKYQDIGFCVQNGTLSGSETTLVVQMFGKPIGGQSALAQTNPVRAQAEEPKPTLQVLPPTGGPTQTPTAEPTVVAQVATINPPESLLPAASIKQSLITKLLNSFPRTAATVFFGMLLFIFVLDAYFAHKLGVYRVLGKHMAHFIFVAFILASLLLVARGTIL